MSFPSSPEKLGLGRERPFWALVALTLGVWLAAAAWPRLLLTLGIHDYGVGFLDSFALLAALDAVRAGADPHGANALDPLMRGHVYSDWWLGLRFVGLTRAHNVAFGTGCVAAFGVTAWLTTRPRRWGEVGWLLLVLASPPVLLALKRANNDLIIFVVVAGCGFAQAVTGWWRLPLALCSLVLATGLKYFPAPVALAFLWVNPPGRRPVAVLSALAGVVATLMLVWPQLDRARFVIASGIHTMGAPLLWREWGWSDQQSALPGLLVLLVAGIALAAGRVTTGLASRGGDRERLLAAIGAIVLLTCFTAGMNYAYRWVFCVWPATWLWRLAFDAQATPTTRRIAGVACGLLGFCLWGDGLLSAVVNLGPPVFTLEELDRFQRHWRQGTQPLHWILMALLAGWLVDGAACLGREAYEARKRARE